MSERTRKWLFWVDEMLGYIEKIEIMTENIEREEFKSRFQIHDVVLMNIANIGETTSHLPVDIKERYDEIDWIGVKDMRNYISHDYPGVDLDRVWVSVKEELSPLKSTLEKIRANENEE